MMKKFLTSREAAHYLEISEEDLKNIINRNKIPSYKIGGIYTRFRVDDLNLYRRKARIRPGQKKAYLASDRIKDFFYFNDFYIFSAILIVFILYLIFK